MAGFWTSLREIFKSEPPPTRVEVTDFARDLARALIAGGFKQSKDRNSEEPDILGFYDSPKVLRLILLGRTEINDPKLPCGPALHVKFVFVDNGGMEIWLKEETGQFVKKPLEDEPHYILENDKKVSVKYSHIITKSDDYLRFDANKIYRWKDRGKLTEHIRLWTQNNASYETAKKLTNMRWVKPEPDAPTLKTPADFDKVLAQLQGEDPKKPKGPSPQ